jgi:hypothetical protein
VAPNLKVPVADRQVQMVRAFAAPANAAPIPLATLTAMFTAA